MIGGGGNDGDATPHSVGGVTLGSRNFSPSIRPPRGASLRGARPRSVRRGRTCSKTSLSALAHRHLPLIVTPEHRTRGRGARPLRHGGPRTRALVLLTPPPGRPRPRRRSGRSVDAPPLGIHESQVERSTVGKPVGLLRWPSRVLAKLFAFARSRGRRRSCRVTDRCRPTFCFFFLVRDQSRRMSRDSTAITTVTRVPLRCSRFPHASLASVYVDRRRRCAKNLDRVPQPLVGAYTTPGAIPMSPVGLLRSPCARKVCVSEMADPETVPHVHTRARLVQTDAAATFRHRRHGRLG